MVENRERWKACAERNRSGQRGRACVVIAVARFGHELASIVLDGDAAEKALRDIDDRRKLEEAQLREDAEALERRARIGEALARLRETL